MLNFVQPAKNDNGDIAGLSPCQGSSFFPAITGVRASESLSTSGGPAECLSNEHRLKSFHTSDCPFCKGFGIDLRSDRIRLTHRAIGHA